MQCWIPCLAKGAEAKNHCNHSPRKGRKLTIHPFFSFSTIKPSNSQNDPADLRRLIEGKLLDLFRSWSASTKFGQTERVNET